MNRLKRGDEVAILPLHGSPPGDVLGIAIVDYVGLNRLKWPTAEYFSPATAAVCMESRTVGSCRQRKSADRY